MAQASRRRTVLRVLSILRLDLMLLPCGLCACSVQLLCALTVAIRMYAGIRFHRFVQQHVFDKRCRAKLESVFLPPPCASLSSFFPCPPFRRCRQPYQMKLTDSVLASGISRMFVFAVVNLSMLCFEAVYSQSLKVTAVLFGALSAPPPPPASHGQCPAVGTVYDASLLSAWLPTELAAPPPGGSVMAAVTWLCGTVLNSVCFSVSVTLFVFAVLAWILMRLGLLFPRRTFTSLTFVALQYAVAATMLYVYDWDMRSRVLPFQMVQQLVVHPLPTVLLGLVCLCPAVVLGKIVAWGVSGDHDDHDDHDGPADARGAGRGRIPAALAVVPAARQHQRALAAAIRDVPMLLVLHFLNGMCVLLGAAVARRYGLLLFPEHVPVPVPDLSLELLVTAVVGPLCVATLLWKYFCLMRVLWRKSAAAKCHLAATAHMRRMSLPRVVRDLYACWAALLDDFARHDLESMPMRALLLLCRAMLALREAGTRSDLRTTLPVQLTVANGSGRDVDLSGIAIQLRSWTGRSIMHTVPLPRILWKKHVLAELSLRKPGRAAAPNVDRVVVPYTGSDTQFQRIDANLCFNVRRRPFTRAMRSLEARLLPRWMRLFTMWSRTMDGRHGRGTMRDFMATLTGGRGMAGADPIGRAAADDDGDDDDDWAMRNDDTSSDDSDTDHDATGALGRARNRRARAARRARRGGATMRMHTLFEELRFAGEMFMDEVVGRAPDPGVAASFGWMLPAFLGGRRVGTNMFGVDRGAHHEVVIVLRYPEGPILPFLSELCIPIANFKRGAWSGPIASSSWLMSFIATHLASMELARRSTWLQRRVPHLPSQHLQDAVNELFTALAHLEAQELEDSSLLDGGLRVATIIDMLDKVGNVDVDVCLCDCVTV